MKLHPLSSNFDKSFVDYIRELEAHIPGVYDDKEKNRCQRPIVSNISDFEY